MERRDFLKVLGLSSASMLAPISTSRAQTETDVWVDEYVFPQPSNMHTVVGLYLELFEGTHDVHVQFEGLTQVHGIRTFIEPEQVLAQLRANDIDMWPTQVDLTVFNTDDCWCHVDLPVGPMTFKLEPQQDVLLPLMLVVSPIKTMDEQIAELEARGIPVGIWGNASRGWFGLKPEEEK